MLKKDIKIIKSMLNPEKNRISKAFFEGGFYYVCDGYRMVRWDSSTLDLLGEMIAGKEASIPLFDESENHCNIMPELQVVANINDWQEVKIPYTLKQIKEWYKYMRDDLGRLAFNIGLPIELKGFTSMEINFRYLIDALETTKNFTLKASTKGRRILVEGNGFTWIIMPIAGKHEPVMTEIGVMV